MRTPLAVAVLLASCGSTPPEPAQAAVPTPPAIDAGNADASPSTAVAVDAAPPVDATPAFAGLSPDFAITFERTRCFGTYPASTLTISAITVEASVRGSSAAAGDVASAGGAGAGCPDERRQG